MCVCVRERENVFVRGIEYVFVCERAFKGILKVGGPLLHKKVCPFGCVSDIF